MITGVNHITLAVADLDRALAFYTDGLGAALAHRWEAGAYLTLGDLWLCLSCDAPNPARDYTHIALDVAQADFDAACMRLARAGARPWKANRSEGASFYFTDPEGHRLELHVGSLASRLEALASREAAPCTG